MGKPEEKKVEIKPADLSKKKNKFEEMKNKANIKVELPTEQPIRRKKKAPVVEEEVPFLKEEEVESAPPPPKDKVSDEFAEKEKKPKEEENNYNTERYTRKACYRCSRKRGRWYRYKRK